MQSPLVLVVSDDLLFRELLAELLRQERLEVVEAETPDAARTVLAGRSPAVALVDGMVDPSVALGVVEPPLGDGPTATLVVVASMAGTEPLSHPGIDRVLRTPFRSETLVAAVREHLDARPRTAMSSGIHAKSWARETEPDLGQVVRSVLAKR